MNWPKARETCTASLGKFPHAARILAACATVEDILLNRDEALRLSRRAAALDPLSPQMHGAVMFSLYHCDQFDEALKKRTSRSRMDRRADFVPAFGVDFSSQRRRGSGAENH